MTRTTLIEDLLKDFNSLKRVVGVRALSASGIQGITPTQWGALVLMDCNEGHTVKDIATTLGVTSSAATQLLDGLVKHGYLSRKADPKDRRLVVHRLSKKGEKELKLMKGRMLAKSVKIFGTFSDKELKTYCELTSKLAHGGGKLITS